LKVSRSKRSGAARKRATAAKPGARKTAARKAAVAKAATKPKVAAKAKPKATAKRKVATKPRVAAKPRPKATAKRKVATKPRVAAKAKPKATAKRKVATKPRVAAKAKPKAAAKRKAVTKPRVAAKPKRVSRPKTPPKRHRAAAPKTPKKIVLDRTPNGAPALETRDDAGTHGFVPTPEPTPQVLHRPDGEAADSAEAPARTNRLVPTNAVHTTKRRQRRANWHGQALAVVVAGAIIGLLVLGGRNEPPDVSPLERQSASTAPAPSDDADRSVAVQDRAPAVGEPEPRPPARKTAALAIPRGLNLLELVEIERMLVRLDLNPSTPDGVVDSKTESAIRMYQRIAGLPEDGKPSKDLLDDMREVVKILDNSE